MQYKKIFGLNVSGLFFDYKQLYGNAFYIMLNKCYASVLGFLFWKLMTFNFSTNSVGLASSLVSSSGLICAISDLGFEFSLIRYIPETNNRNLLINTAISCVFIASFLGSLIFVMGTGCWAPDLKFIQNNYLWMLFVIFTSIESLNLIIDSIYVAERNAKYALYKSILVNTVRLGIPFLATILILNTAFSIYSSYGISMLLGVIVSFFFFIPRVNINYKFMPAINFNIIKNILSLTLANYVAKFLNLLPQFIYPIMVLNVLGARFSAFFYITWMVYAVALIVPISFAQSLLAEGSSNVDKVNNNLKKAFGFSMALSFIIFIVFYVFGDFILSLFGAKYTENGFGLLRFLAYSIMPQTVNFMYITINQIQKKVNYIVLHTTFIIFSSLLFGYMFMLKLGLEGIGIGFALTHTATACFVLIPLCKYIKEK